MPEKRETTPPPLLLAVLVCDQIIRDAETGKASIIGAFENINAPKYPARHPWLAFFCQLTNGRGKIRISVRLVNVEKDDEVIFEGAADCQFRDVREIANLIFNIGGIVFPQPGEYRFQILAGTEFLGERRIICSQMKLPSEPDGNEQKNA